MTYVEVVMLDILLNLSAAFNMIDHNILLHRVNSFLAIAGAALDWFKSYLRVRSQCVTFLPLVGKRLVWEILPRKALNKCTYIIIIIITEP